MVQDNYFHRISAGSITVKSAKEVEVINNQFSLNAIQVVRSSEGSRLYISCNRSANMVIVFYIIGQQTVLNIICH